MTKTISKLELYRNLKAVSDDVMKNGTVYTVLQHSQPAFQIGPVNNTPAKKFSRSDGKKFMFIGKDIALRDLSRTYKQYLYT